MPTGKSFEKEVQKIYFAAFGRLLENVEYWPKEKSTWYELIGEDALLQEFRDWVPTQTRIGGYPMGEFFAHLKRNGVQAHSQGVTADNPELKALLNEISDRSGGVLVFRNQQKTSIATCLREYSAEVILKAAEQFMETVMNDANRKYAPKDFSETVDQRCYAMQRRLEREKQEAERRQEIEKQLARQLDEQQRVSAANKEIEDARKRFEAEHAEDLGGL